MPASKRIINVNKAPQQTDSHQDTSALVAKVLGEPSVFPDTFTAWIPRWLMQNPNFRLQKGQLPVAPGLHVVGASGEIAVFQNSWVASTAPVTVPAYYIDILGLVHLQGQVKSGTVSSTSTGDVFTLPAGYRPQFKSFFAVASNGAVGICTVDVTGEVRAEVGSNVYFSLDGITFRQYQ